MLDQLKRLALQKLQEKMLGNSLGASETSEAAEAGAGSVIEMLQEKLGSGNIDQVKDLFTNNENSLESNGMFNEVKGKLAEVLQQKGMSAEEAETEAAATAPELLNGIKEKFESNDEADSAFSLEGLSGLLGGNAGDLLNKAKDMLGDDAGGLIDKAQDMLGGLNK